MVDELKIFTPYPYFRHIMIYALNEYERSMFVIDDIDTIISAISDMPKGILPAEEILQAVVDAFSGLAHLESKEVVEFYENIFRDWQKGKMTNEDMLEYLFDFMACIELENRDDGLIIDLGEADYTILPMQEYWCV